MPFTQVIVVIHSVVSICVPMDCSTPGLPVLHHLPGLAPTRVHQVSDATQPSHLGPETRQTWKDPKK